MSETVLPAAWYPDPDEPTRLRWWDGGDWTEHVQALPAPPTGQLSPVTATVERDPFIISTHVEELGTWYAETGNRLPPRTTSGRSEAPEPAETSGVGSAWTGEIWIIAILPAVAFGLLYLLWAMEGGMEKIVTEDPVLFWFIPTALIVAGPILAALDRRTLAARKLEDAPHALLGLLPPIYLAVRASRVGAASIVPLLLWCALALTLYSPARKLLTAFLMVMDQLGT